MSDPVTELGQTPFAYRTRVAFNDIDAAGIVYFAKVLHYFHVAYEALLRDRGLPLEAIFRMSWGAPVVHAEADYQSPLRHGSAFAVEITTERLGTTSATLAFRVVTEDAKPSTDGAPPRAGRLAATGRMAFAAIDMGTFVSIPLPDAFRAVFASLPRTAPPTASA